MGNINGRVTNSTFGDSIVARIRRGDNFNDYDESNPLGEFPVRELKADYFKYFDQLPELDSDSDEDNEVDLRKKVRVKEDFPVPKLRNDEDEDSLEKSAQSTINDVETTRQGSNNHSTDIEIQKSSDQNIGKVPPAAAAPEVNDYCSIISEQNVSSLISTSGCTCSTNGNCNGSLILHNCHICVDKDGEMVDQSSSKSS